MSSLVEIENNWLAAPEHTPVIVCRCCVCAEPICVGEGYWDTVAGAICCECMVEMSAATFLEDVCCEKINIAQAAEEC